jgi:5'(3')-deoxyribonucleotidase
MGPWLAAYNRRFRKKKTDKFLTLDQITNWDMHTLVPETFAIYKFIERKDFFRKLPPIPGAIEGTKKLLDSGHDVTLLSAGSGHALSDKAFWIMEHMEFMKNRAVFTHGKTPKGAFRADVLIDDGPHNISGFRKENPNAFIVAIDYPYTAPARGDADLLVPYTDPEPWTKIVAGIQGFAESGH